MPPYSVHTPSFRYLLRELAEMATGTQNEHEQTISDRLTEYCPRRAQRYDAAHVLLLSWKDEGHRFRP